MRGSSIEHGLFDARDALQLLVHDLDEVHRVEGRVLVNGRDRRDGVADEAHALDAQRVLVLTDGEDAVGDGQVLARDDGVDAGERERLRRVDALDARVRLGRAEDFAVEHARQRDVVGEARLAHALRARVHLAEGLADRPSVLAPLRFFPVRLHRLLFVAVDALARQLGLFAAHARGGQLDRLVNLDVAGAAAEVAGEGFFDLFARRVGVRLQAALWRRGGSRACSSRTARRRCRRRSSCSGWRPSAVAMPLDGLDLAPLGVEAEHEARKNGAPVHEHGARAALAQLAAVLRAGQREVFAQDFEQRLVRREGDLRTARR